jgi:hypothetical protein
VIVCQIRIIILIGATLFTIQAADLGHAQQSLAPTSSVMSDEDLAKSVHNPFADFIKLPIEAETDFRIGPRHNAGESINVEPTIPIPIGADLLLIARPNATMTYLPSPHEQFGLEDLQTSFFLTPLHAIKWLWGIGPILQFPTATGRQLGTARWSAGPTAALVYSNGPWFNGLLTYHLMSFSGDRARGSVNQTYIEPLVSYNFQSGWYAQCDPQMTYDWTATTGNAWVLPMGADVGKTLTLGPQALSLQIGAYDFLKHSSAAAQWEIRLQVTLLFPTT